MTDTLAAINDDSLWLMELEAALIDDCNVNELYQICRGRAIPEELRPDVWRVCLDVRHKSDQMSLFNEIYDLPFQSQLREDCQRAVERIGNDDEDKVSVLSDLESILTFYCKNRQLPYTPDNGWIELLLPLLALKLNRADTYNLFEALRDTYVPKGCAPNGNVYHVLRLLLLYHDPELCTLLDTKKCSPDLYAMPWFRTLFAANCQLGVVLSMWDLYFQHADPFLVFFLALIILINGREQILALKQSSRAELVQFLTNMPCALDGDDVLDFCSLAQYYSLRTPTSFKTDFLKTLYGKQTEHRAAESSPSKVSQALCLPLSVYELIENSSPETLAAAAVRFFLVDCRPAEQYNAGHLNTAFHLDCNLMLQEPQAFATAVQGLLNAQRQSIDAKSNAGGEHLCFMGSGRLDEDQYTHMVVASFLQKNTPYVSLLSGGYAAIHDYFGVQLADKCLAEHDERKCAVCQQESKQRAQQFATTTTLARSTAATSATTSAVRNSATSDLFSRFSTIMKIKSTEVKGKFMDIIATTPTNGHGDANAITTNGNTSGASSQETPERHVKPTERNGRRYRNVPAVFSIDDQQDDAASGGGSYEDPESRVEPANAGSKLPGDTKEIVNVTKYLSSPNIIGAFKCQEVHMNGFMYDAQLIVTPAELIVLRELNRTQAQIIVRRPLTNIVKITAKRRHRDLVTFKYGFPDGDGLQITDMDRLLIPNANQVTELVSRHILQTLDDAQQQT